MYEKLDDQIDPMKKMAIMLVPYSHPHVRDDDVCFLKQREIIVDGYSIILQFSRADYNGMYVDLVSVSGKYMPFLPIGLLCKIGQKFLGDKELTFTEILRNGKKAYNWMQMCKRDGTPISNQMLNDGVEDSFNGFEFTHCSS
jgi:hypothetical protein